MDFKEIEHKIYDKCGLRISNYKIEAESKEYHACQYKVNGLKIICRNAKITPKKIGQFVTFWKRIKNDSIEPFQETDPFDFFVINLQKEKKFGQFVIPKTVLIEKGIISRKTKEGKRAFRVYPSWDNPESKQAIQAQNWQLDYFFEINESTSLDKVAELYKIKKNSASI